MRQSLPGCLLVLWESCCNVINGLVCLNVSSVADCGLLAVPFSAHLWVAIPWNAALGAPMLILYFLTPCIAFAMGIPQCLHLFPVSGLGWIRVPGAGVALGQGFVCKPVCTTQHKHQGWFFGSDHPEVWQDHSVWRGSVEFSSKLVVCVCLFFLPGNNHQCIKTVQTLNSYGSHNSFLISFYFWDPKALALSGQVFTSWPFCLVLQEQWYPGTQPGLPCT